MGAPKVMVPAGPLVTPRTVKTGITVLFHATLVSLFHQLQEVRFQRPPPSCAPARAGSAFQVSGPEETVIFTTAEVAVRPMESVTTAVRA